MENSLLKEIKATGITEEQAIRALTIAGSLLLQSFRFWKELSIVMSKKSSNTLMLN